MLMISHCINDSLTWEVSHLASQGHPIGPGDILACASVLMPDGGISSTNKQLQATSSTEGSSGSHRRLPTDRLPVSPFRTVVCLLALPKYGLVLATTENLQHTLTGEHGGGTAGELASQRLPIRPLYTGRLGGGG